MSLRDYQLAAVDSVELGWREHRRQLGVAATGSGKTVIMATLARRERERVLFLAHRTELINQAMMTFDRWGLRGSMLGEGPGGRFPKVEFATVQGVKLANLECPNFGLVLVDECHHATSEQYLEKLALFPNARVLGVTATPSRSDARALGQIFTRVAFEIGLLRMIHEGHLVPIRAKTLPLEVNIKRLANSKREPTLDENAEAISPMIDALARAVAVEIWDRKAIVFLPRCDVSERFADALRKHGVTAFHAEGGRCSAQDVAAFRSAGSNSALCNAQLFTEGFDCPDIDCVVVLRCTKSKAMYAQMVGRGTRLSPGKTDCVIIDPMWICGEIDLCQPADLIAPNAEHKRILQSKLDEGLTLTEAEEITQAEVEKVLAAKLEAAKKKMKAPRGTVDPLAYAVGIHDSDLQEYEPAMPWELEPPTTAQLAELERRGMWTMRVTRGFAEKLIQRLDKREKLGLASPKQVDVLRRFKVPGAETLTKDQAGRWMQRLLRK